MAVLKPNGSETSQLAKPWWENAEGATESSLVDFIEEQQPSKEFGEADDSQSTDDTVEDDSEGEDELVSQTVYALKKYMKTLPDAPSVLNARLEAQHNHSEAKAKELLMYYQDREWLGEYTIQTELKRMGYAWIDPSTGAYIQNKARIARNLREMSKDPELYLLPRIANQSLLGDLLRILMTDEASKPGHQVAEPEENSHASFSLIDSAFAGFNKTQHVNFIIMPSGGSVLAKASLEICLPHPDMDFLKVATIQVSAQFSPHQGLYHYLVESIQVEKVTDHDLLQTACFLHDVPCPEEELEQREDRTSNGGAMDALGSALWHGTQMVWKKTDGLVRMASQAA